MSLTKKEIANVIRYCNRDLVPDKEFDPLKTYHSDWFPNYFSFLKTKSLQNHLGEAFYQARFVYKLMNALRLTLGKQPGFVKFQIIQYASICEAILDETIAKFHHDEAGKIFASKEYSPYEISKTLSIKHNKNDIYLCKLKTKKGDLKRTRIDFKVNFSIGKNIISKSLGDKFCKLYDLRNNIHILKAHENNYRPKLKEAKEAFEMMMEFVQEIRKYYEKEH